MCEVHSTIKHKGVEVIVFEVLYKIHLVFAQIPPKCCYGQHCYFVFHETLYELSCAPTVNISKDTMFRRVN